jgi:hypothetical protein
MNDTAFHYDTWEEKCDVCHTSVLLTTTNLYLHAWSCWTA